jgi:flagellar basal-body rod protein FlgB
MNETIEILGKLMDSTALRQRVLANNLANANTPGYIRKDVHFGDALADALGKGPEAIRNVSPEVVDDTEARVDESGNSVSIQKEMGEISQNALLYDFAAEMTGQKFELLRKAITGTK